MVSCELLTIAPSGFSAPPKLFTFNSDRLFGVNRNLVLEEGVLVFPSLAYRLLLPRVLLSSSLVQSSDLHLESNNLLLVFGQDIPLLVIYESLELGLGLLKKVFNLD